MKQDKYLLLVGKWGTYFAEAEKEGPGDLTNAEVLTLLNSIEDLKFQLSCAQTVGVKND